MNLDPAITAQYSLGAQPIAQGPPPDGQQYGILVPPGGGSASPGPPEDMDMGGMEDNTPGGRKRNRQLGGSKRAEQNRTAQVCRVPSALSKPIVVNECRSVVGFRG